MMSRLLALLFLFLPTLASAQLPAGCENDASLTGRTDVILCEKWESSTWWQNNWLKIASTTQPVAAVSGDVSNVSIVSSPCIGGNCAKVDIAAGQCCGVAIHKPIPGNRQEVYARYYIKLASNWTPNLTGGGSGGKLPGLADVDAFPDPQCGNGGAFSDGINCWSARAAFRNCTSSTSQDAPAGTDICSADIHGKQATTRFGFYWYLPGSSTANETSQAFGLWDTWKTATASGGSGTCANDSLVLGNWSAVPCGKVSTVGNGGLVNDHWYMVEMYHKMNTPGQANGVTRGWLNGQLLYEKTNVVYRYVGHDNLHVRTFWLDIFFGGEFVGPTVSTSAHIDELVILDASGWGGNMALRPGAWKKVAAAYTTPSTVTVGAAPATGGACASSGGASYLESAANALAPGNYCTLTMTGFNWSLIAANDGGGNMLEYANQGVYDPVAKQIRYVGAEDSTPTSGSGVKYLIYNLSNNTWTGNNSQPFTDQLSHTWAGNAINPVTGINYIARARTSANEIRQWNGSSWSLITLGPWSAASPLIMALAWDENRNGLFAFIQSQGLYFWPSGGSWQSLGTAPNGDGSYHHTAHFIKSSGNILLTNGIGTASRFWVYTPGGSFVERNNAPITMNCCGSGGNLTTYDYRTGRFLVVNQRNSTMYEYNDVTNTWTGPLTRVPLNQTYDNGNVQAISVPISDFGGVIMFIVYRGNGNNPAAFLYKHG